MNNTDANYTFSLYEAVGKYLELGFKLFLLPEGNGKTPFRNCDACDGLSGEEHYAVCPCLPVNGGTGTCHGVRAATDDLAILMGWINKNPRGRIAVDLGSVSGDVFVYEYDPKNGGTESHKELLSIHGSFPVTLTDESPSGGLHFFFRFPTEMKYGNIHGQLMTGIDLKGLHGYVMLPPSAGYTTVTEAPIAEAPKWLVAYIENYNKPKVSPRLREDKPADVDLDSVDVQESAQATVSYWLGRIVSAPDGNQNTLIYTAARVLGSLAYYELLDEEDARDLLEGACDDGGHPYARANGTISSGIRAGLRSPDSLEDLVNPDRTVIKTFTWDDFGNANRIVFWRGEDIRYDRVRDEFFVWNGKHWECSGAAEIRSIVTGVFSRIFASEGKFYSDEVLVVEDDKKAAPKTPRELFKTWANSQGYSRKVTDAVTALKSVQQIWCTNEDFDVTPYHLNVDNGVINLKTGELEPHAREHMFTTTLGVKYDAKASASEWERFMEIVMPNKGHRAYVQRLAGLTILGEVTEQAFILNVGKGGRGKGVFLDVMSNMLGTYAVKGDRKAFIEAGSQRTFEMYAWEGKRMVYVDEIGNAKLNEEFIKEITGGDRVIVEGKGKAHKEFTPQFTVWLRTNDVPQMTNDTAMKRRLLLVKWLAKEITSEVWDSFKDQDNRIVPNYLYANEGSGILNWLLKGLADYRKGGLQTPAEWVKEAAEVLEEGDTESMFLRECTEAVKGATAPIKDVYERYMAYYKNSNGTDRGMLGKKTFNQTMENRYGFEKDKDKYRPNWVDLQLRSGVQAVGGRK